MQFNVPCQCFKIKSDIFGLILVLHKCVCVILLLQMFKAELILTFLYTVGWARLVIHSNASYSLKSSSIYRAAVNVMARSWHFPANPRRILKDLFC